MAKQELLHHLIELVVETLGYQLWGVDYLAQGKNSVVRVFIDTENGVNVDDCAKVSHQLSALFDVEDPIKTEYTLEVSSPGLDRPLYTKPQFEAYKGSRVKVRLKMPFDGRRKFTGVIQGLEDDEVVIRQDNEEFILPLELIERAVVEPTF